MSITILPELPLGASLRLEVPLAYVRAVRGIARFTLDRPHRIATVILDPREITKFREFRFPKGAKLKMRFVVDLPPSRRKGAHELTVTQAWRGETLGGITWRIERAGHVPRGVPPRPIARVREEPRRRERPAPAKPAKPARRRPR